MPDRVDPLAGWFDFSGVKPVGELPGLEDSRVTQPRSAESQGMTQRTVTQLRKRIAAAAMTPATTMANFANAVGYVTDVGTASSQTLLYSLDDFPTGTVINYIRWQSKVAIGVGNDVNVGLAIYDQSAPATPTTGFSKLSTKSGAWAIDQIDLSTSNFDISRTIESTKLYVLSLVGTSSGAGGWNAAWVEIIYTLPG